MTDLLAAIVTFVNIPSAARAIVFAFVASFALTQGIKYTFPDALSNSSHRAFTQLTAYAIACFVCAGLWPAHEPNGILISFIVGLCSPMFYQIVTFFLYKYAPGLEDRLSARPTGKSL